MGILAFGFAVMLLLIQVISSHSPVENKTPLWIAILLSVFWPVTLIWFIWLKGNLKNALLEITKHLKKPIS